MTRHFDWARRLSVGAYAGVLGGVASSIVLWVVMEPIIDQAIALEEGHDHAHTHGPSSADGAAQAEIVTRLQQQVGGTLTVLVTGVLLGIVFAVVYARSTHRLSGSTDLGKSLHLATLAFVVHAVLPAIVVPANPPGVGDPETINFRTLWYLATVLIGILFCGASFALSRLMERRGADAWHRWCALAAFITLGVATVNAAPHMAENIPPSMPAALLWEFRIGSLTQLAAMWAAIGVAHGIAHHRFRTRRVGTPAASAPWSAQQYRAGSR